MTDTSTIPDMEKRLEYAAWDDERRAAVEAYKTALKAIDEKHEAQGLDLNDPTWSSFAEFKRCAKSGLVLFDEDEVIIEHETGEVFLRAALGLPPRPVDDDEDEYEDEETSGESDAA